MQPILNETPVSEAISSWSVPQMTMIPVEVAEGEEGLHRGAVPGLFHFSS